MKKFKDELIAETDDWIVYADEDGKIKAQSIYDHDEIREAAVAEDGAILVDEGEIWIEVAKI